MKSLIQDIKKFNQILNEQQKIRIFIIGAMMVIGAGLELLGVSMIIPFISAVMEPEVLDNNKYAIIVKDLFHLQSSQQLIIVILVALIIIYILKNLYLYLQSYVQIRFVCNNRFATQKQLMEVYLHRSYEFFLESNIADIQRVIEGDVSNVFALLTTILSFFTEFVVTVTLVLMIILVDPWMAAMICIVLVVLMFLIGKFLKPVLKKAGNEVRTNAALSSKWLTQSIHGIKDIKVAGKEDFFLEQYVKYGGKTVGSEKKNQVLMNAPRLLIEAICMDGMLVVLLVMIISGRDLATMLPQLSAFAMAAVRLLPSANRMTAYLNAIPYQEVGLDQLMENLFALNQEKAEYQKDAVQDKKIQLTLTQACQLRHVAYSYKNAEKFVLEDASMEIPVGMSVGIVGTSGAGKTTAVDILLGLLHPQKGQVTADGIDVQQNLSSWLGHLSYVPQAIYLLDDTVRANVAFGMEQDKVTDEDVWRALEDAMLAEYIRTLPDGLDTRVGERGVRFSGGQRQRIGIARALYTNPELLIFDEATSALDNQTEADIMESIHHLHGKKTLVIIAHRLGTIEACDIVYKVENGKIVRER